MPVYQPAALKEIIAYLTSSEMEKVTSEALPMSEAKNAVARNEIVAKVISTVLGLAASFSITYFGVKWLVNAMDPTRKEKQEAQTRVNTGDTPACYIDCGFFSWLIVLQERTVV